MHNCHSFLETAGKNLLDSLECRPGIEPDRGQPGWDNEEEAAVLQRQEEEASPRFPLIGSRTGAGERARSRIAVFRPKSVALRDRRVCA